MFVFSGFFLLGTTILSVWVAVQPGPFGSWPFSFLLFFIFIFLERGGQEGVREPLGGTEYSPLQKDRRPILTCPLRRRRFLIPPPLNKEGKRLTFWAVSDRVFVVVVVVRYESRNKKQMDKIVAFYSARNNKKNRNRKKTGSQFWQRFGNKWGGALT